MEDTEVEAAAGQAVVRSHLVFGSDSKREVRPSVDVAGVVAAAALVDIPFASSEPCWRAQMDPCRKWSNSKWSPSFACVRSEVDHRTHRRSLRRHLWRAKVLHFPGESYGGPAGMRILPLVLRDHLSAGL